MSGSPTQGSPQTVQPAGQPADPSMEDILASIRRILSEEEAAVNTSPPPAAPSSEFLAEDVLELDESMIVHEPVTMSEPEPMPEPMPEPTPEPVATAVEPSEAAPVEPSPAAPASVMVAGVMEASVMEAREMEAREMGSSAMTPGIMAPAAAAAAASSVGDLVRTLTVERSMQVRSAGPTIEDIVREEIRMLLKIWLDENLPPIVERLVRIEIERVVGRVVP